MIDSIEQKFQRFRLRNHLFFFFFPIHMIFFSLFFWNHFVSYFLLGSFNNFHWFTFFRFLFQNFLLLVEKNVSLLIQDCLQRTFRHIAVIHLNTERYTLNQVF